MENLFELNNNASNPRVAIVGGGLVGALNACFFAKRGWNVDVYEFREDIRNLEHVAGRSINLAMSFRARQALAAVGLEQHVLDNGIPMSARIIHEPNGKTWKMPYGRPGQYIVSINRRQLNELMLTEAEKFPDVRLFFGHKLISVDLEKNQMTFEKLSSKEKVVQQADLILGCDGAYSSTRRSLMKVPLFNYSQEYIDSAYVELNIRPTKTDEFAMDPGYFHLWPRGEFCLIALGNRDKTFTVTLFGSNRVFRQLQSDEAILSFFEEHFPDATKLIEHKNILDIFHSVRPSPLVSVKCSPHHFGSGVLLMGDAAHAMVPYYGQGMNCLRYLVNMPSFQLRKKIDYFLNSLFPRGWIPLYSMVTFTRIPYGEVLRRRKWQDKVLRNVALLGVVAAVGGGSYAIFKNLK